MPTSRFWCRAAAKRKDASTRRSWGLCSNPGCGSRLYVTRQPKHCFESRSLCDRTSRQAYDHPRRRFHKGPRVYATFLDGDRTQIQADGRLPTHAVSQRHNTLRTLRRHRFAPGEHAS